MVLASGSVYFPFKDNLGNNREECQQYDQQEYQAAQAKGDAKYLYSSRSAAYRTLAGLDNRVAVRPLGVKRHIALDDIRFKIPFLAQVDILVPALKMLALANGISGPGQRFAVNGYHGVDWRSAVALELDCTVRGQYDRQFICLTAVTAASVGERHQKILIRYGGNAGLSDDLQLKTAYAGRGRPLSTAGQGNKVHIELAVIIHQRNIRGLYAVTQQRAVGHQLKILAVVSYFVLHCVHSVCRVSIGAIKVQCYGYYVARVDLHCVFAVYRQLIPELRCIRRQRRKAERGEQEQNCQEENKPFF